MDEHAAAPITPDKTHVARMLAQYQASLIDSLFSHQKPLGFAAGDPLKGLAFITPDMAAGLSARSINFKNLINDGVLLVATHTAEQTELPGITLEAKPDALPGLNEQLRLYNQSLFTSIAEQEERNRVPAQEANNGPLKDKTHIHWCALFQDALAGLPRLDPADEHTTARRALPEDTAQWNATVGDLIDIIEAQNREVADANLKLDKAESALRLKPLPALRPAFREVYQLSNIAEGKEPPETFIDALKEGRVLINLDRLKERAQPFRDSSWAVG